MMMEERLEKDTEDKMKSERLTALPLIQRLLMKVLQTLEQ